MTALIVNADDFGLTPTTSRAIERAHREGLVTSTSVLAVAPAAVASLAALDAPDLDVGVHVALVGEDPPLLGRSEVPTLVDRRGRFPTSWRALLARVHRLDPDDVRREVEAQVDLVVASGRPVTHLDAHQHVHLLAPVGRVLVDVATARGIAWVRVPRPTRRGPRGRALGHLAGGLADGVAAAGLRSPGAHAGLDGAGRLDGPALRAALTHLAGTGEAVVELNVHPGGHVDPERARYAWSYRWSAELDALLDPATARHAAALGLQPTRRTAITP